MGQHGEGTRVAVLAVPDTILRGRLRESLTNMRWQVREARGGAEAMLCLDEQPAAEILVFDAWLPDLEINAFADVVRLLHPALALLWLDEKREANSFGSSRFLELIQKLRAAMTDHSDECASKKPQVSVMTEVPVVQSSKGRPSFPQSVGAEEWHVSGLIGRSAPMRELSRLIRLVAPHDARVLIEGETGTGKELVAKALHQLSPRSKKAIIVLNCAAIPEALLEAELFGHTRGAFTGATQSRVGRIEAANGGTLFLDEIGEMPIALQSKLLRFLENGELQRVGDNETIRVDVRVIAATHRNLDDSVSEGSFRLDLLHRLSVFPIEVPSLRERLDDLPMLAEHFLSVLAQDMPRKRLGPGALDILVKHSWPGNVRELGHVLHRGAILAGPQPDITINEIRLRRTERR